jgi:hypothetical protein
MLRPPFTPIASWALTVEKKQIADILKTPSDKIFVTFFIIIDFIADFSNAMPVEKIVCFYAVSQCVKFSTTASFNIKQ